MSKAVLQVMTEWANAARGDWSFLDERSVDYTVEYWVAALEGQEPWASYSIKKWREFEMLCPNGKGHWDWNCRYYKCKR